ncbi:uncharacterized protein LOC106350173 [Brassica napus]|uniref:uncharacterized protein LOC106350173 n=1 Tax=Brassica napus TaxID=3708 RepID=UPI0006AA7BF5|nr:uncharacterized protein LOC106350173 [Brassica napus]
MEEDERDRTPCDLKVRVERNVRDFVDEDVDLFATPVGSDDEDDNEGDGYLTYKKGSGELRLRQAFDSLHAFKQAMVDYVLKYGWNVKYIRWDKDKSELKCASEAEEGEEACMWRIYCSYEAPLQKWMVKVSNEDSTVELETLYGDDDEDVFYRFYVCFSALKKTWCAHCRPIFGLDACFLKCTTKGQLLAAVGRDAKNQMFPIAWAVVEVESEDNWVWFIEKLQVDLNLHDGEGFTVISDRQKGLLNAVSNLLPMVEHRMCARHIYANLKKNHPHRTDMKGKFWKVAKSYNIAQYNKRLDQVKAYNMSVYDSMMMKNPKNCSLAFFTTSSMCDDVSNNISESFNHAVDPARAMPLVEMLETIRSRAMLRIEARKLISKSHRGKFSIKAMEKRKQEDYMADCYLTSTWRKQYETPIEAVCGITFWEKSEDARIIPPPTAPEQSRGRRKIPKRIKGRNESPSKKKTKDRNESPSKVSRERRIIHCGRCGEGGHNSRKCANVGVPIQRPPKKKNVTQGEGSSQQPQSLVFE